MALLKTIIKALDNTIILIGTYNRMEKKQKIKNKNKMYSKVTQHRYVYCATE